MSERELAALWLAVKRTAAINKIDGFVLLHAAARRAITAPVAPGRRP